MNRHISRLMGALISVLLITTFAGIPRLQAADDSQNMEKLQKMFQSPYSEEDYYRTDHLLTTATGSQLPIHKAPAVADIITAKDIERIGATSLDEILETVPGIHVAPSVDSGYRSDYQIRGIATGLNQQVLLLINGIPINTLYEGTRQVGFHLPVEDISRIEIIRGPGSAVHGADAFAGTINIITKDAHELKDFHAGIRYGSFETYDAWLQGGKIWEGLEIAASVEYGKSQGDKNRIITSDEQTILDSLFHTHASLAPGALDTRYKYLESNLSFRKGPWNLRQRFWTNLDVYPYWAGVTNTLSNGNDLQANSYLADLRYEDPKFAFNWGLDVGLNYLYQRSDFKLVLFPPGTTVLIGPDGNLFTGNNVVSFPDGVIGAPKRTEQTIGVDVSTIYSGVSDHRIRLGTGAKYMKLEAQSSANFGPGVIDGNDPVIEGTLTDVTGTDLMYVPDKSRRLLFVFAQDEWSFARHWTLTGGVRYDHYSDFGATFNPRLALVWETRYDLTTKLLYGRAFRLPSFEELYAQNNPAAQGNPNLDPETIQTIELVFDYQTTPKLRNILNLFYYEADNLIELVSNLNGTKTNQNARDQKGYGFEFETNWQVSDTLSFKANCSLQHSHDKKTGDLVANTPRMQFYLNPHWNFWPDWSLDGQVKWVGNRKRAASDTRTDIKNFTVVGLTLRRKNIYENWELALAVRNLFNEDVREPTAAAIPDDYPMQGRSFWIELQTHF